MPTNKSTDFEIVREKLDQAVRILQEKNVDLWLILARETSQVRDPCLDLLLGLDLTWQSVLMIHRSGERVAIVGRYDAPNVERIAGYTDVVGYDHSIREPFLTHLSRFTPRKIALNFSEHDPAADGLTYGMFRLLAKMIADTEYADRLVSAEEIVAALRGHKSPTEIERIRAAIRDTEDIFQQIGTQIRPGLTAYQIAAWFRESVSRLGPEISFAWGEDYCPIVTPGPDAPIGHAMPGDFLTQRGQLLQVDFGIKREGFVSDLQRTWYLFEEGETSPPPEVVAAWNAARAALETGRAALRPGVQGWQVDQAARQALVEAGYPEYMHAFGHHIGRSAHDGATILGPRWERYGTSVEGAVEVGNTFAIELGVRVPNRGYIGCEEDVLVTPDGAEYLSHPQTALWCV